MKEEIEIKKFIKLSLVQKKKRLTDFYKAMIIKIKNVPDGDYYEMKYNEIINDIEEAQSDYLDILFRKILISSKKKQSNNDIQKIKRTLNQVDLISKKEGNLLFDADKELEKKLLEI